MVLGMVQERVNKRMWTYMEGSGNPGEWVRKNCIAIQTRGFRSTEQLL